jgi:hypothetical protein
MKNSASLPALAGDSIPPAAPSPRRGRPRKFVDNAHKMRAYRWRVRYRRTLKEMNKNTPESLQAEWDALPQAEKDYTIESARLSQQLQSARSRNPKTIEDYENILSLEEQIAYTDQLERQRTRPCARGFFLSDAPHGCGLVLSGSMDVVSMSDAQQTRELLGDGRRVVPAGSSSDESASAREFDDTFVERAFSRFAKKEQQPEPPPVVALRECRCFDCNGPAIFVHPEDHGKTLSEGRFWCGICNP